MTSIEAYPFWALVIVDIDVLVMRRRPLRGIPPRRIAADSKPVMKSPLPISTAHARAVLAALRVSALLPTGDAERHDG